MMILEIFGKIIGGTPFWVWIVFYLLIRRGIALLADGEVSIGKSFLMPGIFIVWGLQRLLFEFTYPLQALSTYFCMLMIGAIFGKWLYGKFQLYYYQDGIFMRKGSPLPFIIILVNFIIKYILNVAMSVNPLLTTSFTFDIGYALISGFTVGLFIGGIWNTLNNKKYRKEENHVV